jgi:hypothetical protein
MILSTFFKISTVSYAKEAKGIINTTIFFRRKNLQFINSNKNNFKDITDLT